MQLGQHPEPSHLVLHFSDPHLLAGRARLHGVVDTVEHLGAALAQIESSSLRPDAIVFTGDLADLGEPEAYARLRELVTPVAARLGAQIVWCMGNHDERASYALALFGADADGVGPQDRVYDVRGLRIIALDTTIPGYHHGALDPEQLAWLRDVLATPAEQGTIIALHHPPIPSPLTPEMAVYELDNQDRLAAVIQGTDVRGILGGHLHHSTHSTFAGVPVSVASATCYTLALGDPVTSYGGRDAHQAVAAVHVYPDRIVHTTIPIGDAPLISGVPTEQLRGEFALDLATLRERYAKKRSPSESA